MESEREIVESERLWRVREIGESEREIVESERDWRE